MLSREGMSSRMAIIIEELAELIAEVSKYIQHDDDFNVNQLLDEVVDVKIGIEQLELFFDKAKRVDLNMGKKLYKLQSVAIFGR